MFYVYLIKYPNGRPFYVGKGKKKRINRRLDNSGNGFFRRIIARIVAVGEQPIREIVFQTSDETEAFKEECRLITMYGRRDNGTGILTNLTNGGEGLTGHNPTVWARQKMRVAALGHIVSPETRHKIIMAQRGISRKPLSEKHRAKIGAALIGKIKSSETRLKLSTSLRGKSRKSPSIETREKLSIALKGRRFSDEWKEKLKQAALRRGMNPDYRLMQAEGTRRQWQDENRRVAYKQFQKDRWRTDGEYREKVSEAARLQAIDQWNDPIKRARLLEARKNARILKLKGGVYAIL